MNGAAIATSAAIPRTRLPQLADDGVGDQLPPLRLLLDRVLGPQLPELLAGQRKLADQLREPRVTRMPAALRAQVRDELAAHRVPLRVQPLRAFVGEDEL